MILSISRRTDIPAYYSDWLFRCLREGFVTVRNPMNPGQVRQISLAPSDVDGIVFWSKNPAPMLSRLSELNKYRYYFQFTLTPYGSKIEPGLPDKAAVIDTFKKLSNHIGPERVIWRYDPILLNPVYTVERHIGLFSEMAAGLKGYTNKCTISFIDPYKNTQANASKLALTAIDDGCKMEIARAFTRTASESGMALDTCAEGIDLSALGIGHARCVDARLFNNLWGMNLPTARDRNQRPACLCMQSVDIGVYNTCPGGCLYCYANYNPGAIGKNVAAHDPASPILIGLPNK